MPRPQRGTVCAISVCLPTVRGHASTVTVPHTHVHVQLSAFDAPPVCVDNEPNTSRRPRDVPLLGMEALHFTVEQIVATRSRELHVDSDG